MTDMETWLSRFANLWLASEKDLDLVYSKETVEEGMGKLIKEELKAGVSKEDIKEQEEWLKRFAGLWLTCKQKKISKFQTPVTPEIEPRIEATTREVVQAPLLSGDRPDYSAEVLSELEKGRVVIREARFNGKNPNSSSPGTMDLTKISESELNPNDVIVFDIDPEMAIKIWTASRGLGS